ncbi:MAG: N-acetyltransferase [Oscillospiraceae bacterium]|nr:N-acetyltransferase [Oscillospiraceae bacterium]
MNLNLNLKMRLETPDDYYNVEAMTRETFWGFWEDDRQICDEHFLVSKLRNCAALVTELNYVAELDGELVAHIIYTRARIKDSAGNNHEILTFGPLTVSTEHQSKGIGRALMSHTFEIARSMNFRAVLIYGHPDYYPRVGFRRADEFGITTPDGSVFDALMVYPLYENALDNISGKAYIDPVYESLTQKETLEFDKKFPFKEPYKTVPIDVLLNRLDAGAAEALRMKEYKTLNFLKAVSERELLALQGVDEKAIATISELMKAHKLAWGAEK